MVVVASPPSVRSASAVLVLIAWLSCSTRELIVSVLEIVSASLELSMELSYESATGKVIGKASLEIHVSILCFGITVHYSIMLTLAAISFWIVRAQDCAGHLLWVDHAHVGKIGRLVHL